MRRGAAVTTVRKTFQALAFTGPAVLLLLLARPDLSVRSAVACMTAALGASSLGAAAPGAALAVHCALPSVETCVEPTVSTLLEHPMQLPTRVLVAVPLDSAPICFLLTLCVCCCSPGRLCGQHVRHCTKVRATCPAAWLLRSHACQYVRPACGCCLPADTQRRARRHAGQMFGLCNTFGCLAAIAGVSTVGYVLEATSSFAAVFQLTAGVYIAAAAAWLLLCQGQVVFD